MSIIKKLVNEDPFYIQPKWAASSFQLTIIEGPNAWYAKVSEDEISKLAKERQKNKDEYFKEVKESLNSDKSNTTFDIKKNGQACQFYIYLKIGNSKINFFVTKMEKIDYQNCVFNVIDEINARNLEFVELIEKSEQDKQTAYTEKEECERKLQEFVDSKSNWEKEMYSNFLLLLNEKKKRIDFLTSLLSKKKIEIDDTTSNADSEAVKEAVSESGSDDDAVGYHTDSEDTKNDSEDMETQPSTSKHSDLLGSDSPPPVLLPKRVRSNLLGLDSQPPLIMPKRVKSGTRVETLAPVKTSVKVKQKTPEPEVMQEEVNTPALTFTTQDIIDRM